MAHVFPAQETLVFPFWLFVRAERDNAVIVFCEEERDGLGRAPFANPNPEYLTSLTPKC